LEKDFPDWNKLYNTQNIETTPWYNENLDSDLEEELESRKITKVGFWTIVTILLFKGKYLMPVNTSTSYSENNPNVYRIYIIDKNVFDRTCLRSFYCNIITITYLYLLLLQ
jgi:hypothetical protein